MILCRKTAKETCGSRVGSVCGSRTEEMQKNRNTFISLAVVIRKNQRNAAGNSEKIVHPWYRE